MDKRIIKIVKAAGVGIETDEDGMHVGCAFCGGAKDWDARWGSTEDITIIQHEQGCPTLLARDLLREWGMPLKVWRVDYEDRRAVSRKEHTYIANSQYRLATSPEEAVHDFTWEGIRNVRATFVREWMEVV